MKKNQNVLAGILLLVGFAVWTFLIQEVDVQPIGPNESTVGFAALNGWFHQLTGVHWMLYTLTDWLGLVPICVCLIFAGAGFVQLVQRRSLFKVDLDIIMLGAYYVLVIFGYLLFEMVPINYRPVLIEGFLEASYPSSTTLLVLSVMPTLYFQAQRRLNPNALRQTILIFSVLFSAFMVIGRLVSGVHWLTDIVGAVLLSSGIFLIYKASVNFLCKR